MAEIGNGTGSGYPTAIDTDTTTEVNAPNANKTKARAEVVNDLASCVIAVETALGTSPQGTKTDVKTYLQVEHGVDGTHKNTIVGLLAGTQSFTGEKTFTKIVHFSKGADIASAASLTLGTDGNYFDVTGTTTITGIATVGVGTVVVLHFDGVLTITHHATNLVLPGGVNITTAAGDEYVFVEYVAGQWRLVAGNKPFDGSVTTAKIADLAVTTAKLAAANVTLAKLKFGLGGWTALDTGSASGYVAVDKYGHTGQIRIFDPGAGTATLTVTAESQVSQAGDGTDSGYVGPYIKVVATGGDAQTDWYAQWDYHSN